MSELFEYTTEDKLSEIRREIGMRMTLYPRWLKDKKISQQKADKQIGILRAIARDYEEQAKKAGI